MNVNGSGASAGMRVHGRELRLAGTVGNKTGRGAIFFNWRWIVLKGVKDGEGVVEIELEVGGGKSNIICVSDFGVLTACFRLMRRNDLHDIDRSFDRIDNKRR